MVSIAEGKETLFGKVIIQVKTNTSPRGLVALETNFYNVDSIFNRNMSASRDVEENDLGTKKKPRKIWLGSNLRKEEKHSYVQLLKKYQEFMAWTYCELKEYREDLFQHGIPLESDANPFKNKQRPINPVICLKMQ